MTTIPSIPLPDAETIAFAVLAFLTGATVPTYHAQERLRGFGRAIMDRLPYVAPPGMTEEEALQALESTEEAVEDNP